MNLAFVAILTFLSINGKAKVLNKHDDSVLSMGVIQSENHKMHIINNSSYSQNEKKQFNGTGKSKKRMQQMLSSFLRNLNIIGRTRTAYPSKKHERRDLLLHKRKVEKNTEHATINNKMLLIQERASSSRKVLATRASVLKDFFENETIKDFDVEIVSVSNNSVGIKKENCTQNALPTSDMIVIQNKKSYQSPTKTVNFLSSFVTQRDVLKINQTIENDVGNTPIALNSSNSTMQVHSEQYFTTEIMQKYRDLESVSLNQTTGVNLNNVRKIDDQMEASLNLSDTNSDTENKALKYLLHQKGSIARLTAKKVLSEINLFKVVTSAPYEDGGNGKAVQYYEESPTKKSIMLKKHNPSQDSTVGNLVIQYDEESYLSSLNSITDAPKDERKTKELLAENEITDRPATALFFDDGFSCHKQKRSVFATEESLHCPPCEQIHCYRQRKRRLKCRGGYALDICGCCRVCAKLEGEQCGGQHDYLGKCDKDLFCEPQPPAVVSFFREGTKRVYKVHRGICKKFDTKLGTDINWARNTCKPKCEPEFCMKNPRAICSANNAAEMARSCQGSCQHTSCRACRFVKPDIQCPKCLMNDFRCIRQFGRCIRKDSCKPKSYPCGNQSPGKHDAEVFLCKVPECDVSN